MTEQEAKARAIKETKYCYTLASAWEGKEYESICLERIFTRERGEEEIRLSWWKGGRLVNRPADIDAVNWVRLFEKAVREGVFTDSEILGMKTVLQL